MPCSVINNRKCVRKVVHIWAITTFWIIGKRLSIKGFDKIDATKKYIIVANHASLFDIMAIMKVFPGISWFGRERLLKIPLFGTVLKMIDYIPMKTGDIKNTRQIAPFAKEVDQLCHSVCVNKHASITWAIYDPEYFGSLIFLEHNETSLLPGPKIHRLICSFNTPSN